MLKKENKSANLPTWLNNMLRINLNTSSKRIFFFNLILMILVLLYSAGYFAPYFPITINIIFFISLVLSIFLFKANSQVIFLIAITFLLFGMCLRFLGINIWAERTLIYTYQALCIGVVLVIFETVTEKSKYTKKDI